MRDRERERDIYIYIHMHIHYTSLYIIYTFIVSDVQWCFTCHVPIFQVASMCSVAYLRSWSWQNMTMCSERLPTSCSWWLAPLSCVNIYIYIILLLWYNIQLYIYIYIHLYHLISHFDIYIYIVFFYYYYCNPTIDSIIYICH